MGVRDSIGTSIVQIMEPTYFLMGCLNIWFRSSFDLLSLTVGRERNGGKWTSRASEGPPHLAYMSKILLLRMGPKP